ncbi:MAG TPA: type II toxin-antitoxin system HicA family toxin [Candidatus Glassbacteria bacterium]|nr:type II toxin-antitoxin system HicA family toxin [Candidatus Glassbacteria bacterium]
MPRLTPVHWKVLECIFLKYGFEFDRSVGSHNAYVKKGVLRLVIIPRYKEVDKDIIQSNMRTAGMSREEYFRLLEECS